MYASKRWTHKTAAGTTTSQSTCSGCQDFKQACVAHLDRIKHDRYRAYGSRNIKIHANTADLVASARRGCHYCRCWIVALLGECLKPATQATLLASRQPIMIQSPTSVYEPVRSGMNGTRVAHFFTINSTVKANLRLTNVSDAEFRALTDRGGAVSAKKVRSWLQACHTSHLSCKELAHDSYVPTRLLDIANELVQLVDGSMLTRPRYVAISYCWGGNQSLMFTTENEDTLRAGIPAAAFSPSIRDAIVFCRKLNVKFLWVDALCINQDGLDEDWKREAAQNHRIYGNAYATLSLSYASKAMDGMSVADDLLDLLIDPERCRLLDLLPVPSRKTLAHIRTQTPVAARGWIFQEELLSPRIIYWSNQGLFWSCSELDDAENGTARAGRDDLFPQLQVPEAIDPHEFSKTPDPLLLWDDMITAYSVRKFTVDDDRLPAVAGLATLIEQRTGERYLAGLWESRLPAQLLWTVQHAPNRHSQARHISTSGTSRPPSWSWAGIESGRKVVMPKQASARALFKGRHTHEQQTVLQVQGRVRKMTAGLEQLPEMPSERHEYAAGPRYPQLQQRPNVWAVDQSRGQILLCREWTKPIIVNIDHELPTSFDDLLCLEINYIGLLLLQPSLEGSLTYRRIGCTPSHRDAGFFSNAETVEVLLI